MPRRKKALDVEVFPETTEVEKETVAPEKVEKKKEYKIVLVKPTRLVIDFDGTNRSISRSGHEHLEIGDSVRL